MSIPHRQPRSADLEHDAPSDIEREAMLLVERVNRRIQELRDQRTVTGGGQPQPAATHDGGADAPRRQPPPRQTDD